jgi:hypothetical protein
MKKYILLPVIASMIMPAMAQESNFVQEPTRKFQRHEISIYGTIGRAALWIHSDNISFPKKLFDEAIGGGVGYTFFFHRHWGIATGAEVAFFHANEYRSEISESTLETYSYGGVTEPMYFNSTLKSYQETQRATYIHVPLMLQFQTAGRHKFYVAAGAKAGLALSGKYETTVANLETSGYFPESDQTFTNMPSRGFTTVQKPSWTGTIDFGLNVSAAAEVGARWAMGKQMALYTGVYLDYGLLDVAPEKAAGLVSRQSDTPSKFIYTNVLAAYNPLTGAAYVDKVNLFSVGIKMRLAVGW